MSRTILAYLAGVIDSDGCVTIKRRRVATAAEWNMQAAVFVRQVTTEATSLLQETFGGRINVHPPSTEGGRSLFHWCADRKRAISVCKSLLPYLRIKKRQAEILIEFDKYISDSRQRCIVTHFKWSADEPCYTIEQAAAAKDCSAQTIYQAISNNSIPSKKTPGRGRGTRWIPKRFWDDYTPRKGRRLPIEYLERRNAFHSAIHSLNGPTRGIRSADRQPV